jgi:hypothetical protein
MKRMREYWSSKVILLGTLVVASACANAAPDVGGESHFACQSDGDCPSSAASCVKQVCQSPTVGQGSGGAGVRGTGGSTSTGGTIATGGNKSGSSGGVGGHVPLGSGGTTIDGSADAKAGTDASAGGTCSPECPTKACGSEGLQCPVDELCVQHEIAGQGPTRSSWVCGPNHCVGTPLDCSCATGLCQNENCYTGTGYDVLCIYYAVCAHPDTPIATPEGERRIAELAVGDLVYSVDHGAMTIVPIVRVGRTLVRGHSVMQVSLASGPVLKISPGHPTADGRRFGELRAGDSLDGVEIASARMIPYAPEATYDILPNSDSGAYFAGGVLVGSTLAREPELVMIPTAPVGVGSSSL